MDFDTLKDACKTFTNVVLYSQLKGRSITDMLHPITKSCIILILFTPDSGHYVCCWQSTTRLNSQTLMYFDPFGNPDYFDKKHGLNNYLPISPEMQRITNQQGQILFESFIKSTFTKISYNDFILQHARSSCGGWCVLRVLNRNLSHRQFYLKFKNEEIKTLQILSFIKYNVIDKFSEFQ
jgi:hypothetical protein